MEQNKQVLEFWFGKVGRELKPRKEWFVKDEAFDKKVRLLFLKDYEEAAQGKLEHWRNAPESCLALIILLDQFPRNMFRNSPQAFATDNYALAIAKGAVNKGFDQELLPVERWFIYLPFEHSESLEMQQEAVRLFASLKDDPASAGTREYAEKHLKIIERFGRFPHRNEILGRESTPAEIEFLQEPGSGF
ncbi:MAG: DUF924 domain-containing protein [Gomphosphaeria aponina SAG 52.96 = DSM 107014]|uniref:DUF924 domain-containing protein n=1 Tax=Gomphosphaeria aponina SAG 52.96 = DSM 107014 TaxID=1521640 RepID=A0A941GZ81_9CHRO|nr:DUF924 domain-containing protein [Gomphosphaeria aponina SAG 52.96 = DSM 107014]